MYTHQGISLGQKIIHIHYLEKHLMELIVYTFLGKKNTNCFVAIKSDFMFNSIQSPQIFRKHCNPLIHGLNTHQQTLTII